MSQQAYVFKWSNYDLGRYIEDRRHVAMQKRREAEILMKQADAMDAEIDALETSMIPCPQKDGEDD